MLKYSAILALFVTCLSYAAPTLGAVPVTRVAMGFDVNDVTVLFPAERGSEPVPAISLAEPGLIESSVLNDLFRITQDPTTFDVESPTNVKEFNSPARWRVVGYRYDPCAPSDSVRGGCAQELRLIVQVMSTFGGPADSALHLLYVLGEGLPTASDPVLQELAALKDGAGTAGVPLGVHPGLKSNAALRERHRRFILRRATSDKLRQVTFMGLVEGRATKWIFIGGSVERGNWRVGTIPNLPSGKDRAIVFDRSDFRTKNTETRIIPAPLNDAPSTLPLFTVAADRIAGDAKLNRDVAAALHRLEDPRRGDRTSIDCMSCHTVTGTRLNASFNLPSYVEGVTAKIPFRITAFAEPSALQDHPTLWNLRNLGYFFSMPSVSQRTVNESALVAEKLNQILGIAPPGRDCSAVQAEITACMIKRSPGMSANPDTCLKLCAL